MVMAILTIFSVPFRKFWNWSELMLAYSGSHVSLHKVNVRLTVIAQGAERRIWHFMCRHASLWHSGSLRVGGTGEEDGDREGILKGQNFRPSWRCGMDRISALSCNVWRIRISVPGGEIWGVRISAPRGDLGWTEFLSQAATFEGSEFLSLAERFEGSEFCPWRIGLRAWKFLVAWSAAGFPAHYQNVTFCWSLSCHPVILELSIMCSVGRCWNSFSEVGTRLEVVFCEFCWWRTRIGALAVEPQYASFESERSFWTRWFIHLLWELQWVPQSLEELGLWLLIERVMGQG